MLPANYHEIEEAIANYQQTKNSRSFKGCGKYICVFTNNSSLQQLIDEKYSFAGPKSGLNVEHANR